MTKDQKELMLKIVTMYSEHFYLNMNDHWTEEDFDNDRRMTAEIDRLEQIYSDQYGPMPSWGNLITNVWKIKAELERETNDIPNF